MVVLLVVVGDADLVVCQHMLVCLVLLVGEAVLGGECVEFGWVSGIWVQWMVV